MFTAIVTAAAFTLGWTAATVLAIFQSEAHREASCRDCRHKALSLDLAAGCDVLPARPPGPGESVTRRKLPTGWRLAEEVLRKRLRPR